MGMMPFILSLSSVQSVTPEPEPDPTDLVFDDSVVTLTGAQTLASVLAGVQNLYQPKMLWNNGKTYYNYQGIYQSEGLGQGYFLVYDEKNGLLKPYRVGSVQQNNPYSLAPDSHTQPNMQIDNAGNIGMFQERTHDTPIDIYKGSSVANMDLLAEKINPGTGATAQSSYHQMIKLQSGNLWSWCRMTTLFETYSGGDGASVESSNGLESWGSLIRNTTNPNPVKVYPTTGQGTDKTRHYPFLPYYRQVAKIDGEDHIICLRVHRLDNFTTSQGYYRKYYIHATPLGTGRGVIFKNLLGTPYSHDVSGANYMTMAVLDANFMILDTGADSNNAYIPVATVSLHPKVFIIMGNGTSNDLFIRIIDIPTRTEVVKALNITGYTKNDQTASQSHHATHIAYIEAGQYLELGIGIDYPSSVTKAHIFRSYDLGDTWEDQGDVAPEIATTTNRLTFPMNYHQIPNNRNFMVSLHAPDVDTTNTARSYIKRAVKGAIQTETPSIVVPAANISDAFNFFDYVAIDGQISRSGNNVTGLTDQFGLRNATGANNPQWNGSDEITLNGTNHSFSIATTGFSGLTKCTFFAIVRRGSTGNSRFFTISNNGDTSNYISFNIATTASSGAPSFTHKIGSGGAELNESSQYVMANGELALIAWVVDGRCKVDTYINGAKQYYQSNGYSTLAHYQTRGLMNFGTITSIRLGLLDTSGTDFHYPFGFKRLTMKNTVYDLDTFRALEKKIADTHGITLNYGYQ